MELTISFSSNFFNIKITWNSLPQDLPIPTCSFTTCGRSEGFVDVSPASQSKHDDKFKEGEEEEYVEGKEERVGHSNLQPDVTI